jgi:hypothetical protein
MRSLESDRLMFRSWNPDTEVEAAFEIYGDPEVSLSLNLEFLHLPRYHSLIKSRAVGKHITLDGETVWLACTMTQTQI